MYQVEKCLICNGTTENTKAGYSDWLIHRIEYTGKIRINSLFCPNCNFVFFDNRLDDVEVEKLYRDYRAAEYNKTRTKYEPAYVDIAKEFENLQSGYWKNRIGEYSRILDALLTKNPKKILDFGGDGYVPGVLFPKSSIEVDDPSIEISSKSGKYEMIFACEVFEHLSDPVLELKKLRKRLTTNGFIFLGVPKEYQDPIKIAWERSKKNSDSLTYMHEHINHFSIRSLNALATKANFKLHSQITTSLNYQIVILTILDKNSLLEKQDRFYLKYLASIH